MDFIETKAIATGDEGIFEGIATAFNIVDRVGDVILPRAFSKSIREKGNSIPILAQHQADDVIGKAVITETSTALLVRGQLSLGLQSARDVE